MTERVRSLDLDICWQPNAPGARFTIDDAGDAVLTLQAHPDDDDDRLVALVWSGALATRFGPYNDEGLHHHPLHDHGLGRVLWIGEVLDSTWRAEVARAVFRAPDHHYVVPTKEALVEVLADGLTVLRGQQPARGC